MNALGWLGIVGSVLLVGACNNEGEDAEPDAPLNASPPTLSNECSAGTARDQVLFEKASLAGQTQTHLYMRAGGDLLGWPKSGGEPKVLAPLADLGPSTHTVTEELIFSVPSSGRRAQLTLLSGEHFILEAPGSGVFGDVDTAPDGELYAISRSSEAMATGIYRLRLAERTFELVHPLDYYVHELQAEDDALYWTRHSLTGELGDYEVMEHVLGTPGERILFPLDSYNGSLQVLGDAFYITTKDWQLQRRDRRTAELLATFPSVPAAMGVIVKDGPRLWLSVPPGMQYSPSCPPSAALYELAEGKAPLVIVPDAAPTAVVDGGILYYRQAFPTCCRSGSCNGGGESVACRKL